MPLTTANELKNQNYYERLGVDKTANTREIKQAYVKFQLQYHPDKNPEVDENIIKYINEAYETLSDDSLRRDYNEKLLQEQKRPLTLFRRQPSRPSFYTVIEKSYRDATGKTEEEAKADLLLLLGRSYDETFRYNVFIDLIFNLFQLPTGEEDIKKTIAKTVFGLPFFQDMVKKEKQERLYRNDDNGFRELIWTFVQLMYLYNEDQLDRTFIYSLVQEITHKQNNIYHFVSTLENLVSKLHTAGLLTKDNLIYLRLLFVKTYDAPVKTNQYILSVNYDRKCELFILLSKANLFESNKDSFEDPENDILWKDNQLNRLLTDIPVYQLTQELWDGILECKRVHQPNPVNAIHTYVIQKLIDTFDFSMQSFKPATGRELLEKLQNAYVDNDGKGLGPFRNFFGDSSEITAAKKYLRKNQDIDFANNPEMALELIKKFIPAVIIQKIRIVTKQSLPQFNATFIALKAILPYIIKHKASRTTRPLDLNYLVRFLEKYPAVEDFARITQRIKSLYQGEAVIGALEKAHIALSDNIIQQLNLWNQLETHVMGSTYRSFELCKIFQFLRENAIPLTQEKLEALLEPQNDYLLRDGFQLLMENLPRYYSGFTAKHWDRIVQSCQGDDPETTLMNCIVEMGGGVKTWRKKNVHAGVANSLRHLDAQYPEPDIDKQTIVSTKLINQTKTSEV